MSKQSEYYEKLKDPRWQKKRLEVFQRDEFTCQSCLDGENTLTVHHRYYDKNVEPWDYPLKSLVTLCESCHQMEYEDQYEIDKQLVRAVRAAGFLNSDIERIIEGLKGFKMPHAPEVTATMLEWMLTNKGLLGHLMDLFFEDLAREMKENR
jgi:hypothetical protein